MAQQLFMWAFHTFCALCAVPPRTTTGRLETPPRGSLDDLGEIWQSSSGCLHHRNINPLSPLVLPSGGWTPWLTLGLRAYCMAFPPIPLIHVILDRVQQGGHRLLLVAPNWPGRPWFPGLPNLLSGGALAPEDAGPPLSTRGTHMASKSPSAVCLAIGSQDMLLESCHQSVIHTVLCSRAPSTRLLYAVQDAR